MKVSIRLSMAKRMHAVGVVPTVLVREKHCSSWLSKIICRVIFYETLCKADASAPARAVDSPPEAAIRSNLRLPIANTALGSSSGAPWTILSQGSRYADDDH
jgi:hypothetical protein